MEAKPRKCRLCLALGLVASLAACKQSTGTFVVLQFDGAIPAGKPIRSIGLSLQLGTRTATTVFQAPGNGAITLPTDATLEFNSGSGDLVGTASAFAADQSLLATGTVSGRVSAGQTTHIPVYLGGTNKDAGANVAPDAQQDGGRVGMDTGADIPNAASDADLLDTFPSVPETADSAHGKSDTGAGGLGTGGAAGAGGISSGGVTGGTGGVSTGGAGGIASGGSSGTFQLSLTAATLDFAAVPVGSVSTPQTLTITNAGTATTPALMVFVDDGHHFPVFQDRCSGAYLKPGDTCTLAVTFNPDTTGGLQTTGWVGPAQGPVANFTMGGTGSYGTPTLALSPSTVDFKTVDVGVSSSVVFTVTNNGAADSGPLKVVASPVSTFQIANDRCSSVALGKQGQCTFSLVFAPQAIGIASATITAQSASGVTATSSAVGVGQDHVQLTVQFAGTGGGSVTGPGLNCLGGAACTVGFPRTDLSSLPRIDLSALANSASLFSGWSDACTGTGNCSIVMDGFKTVTATFDAIPVQLSLNVIGLAGQQGSLVSEDGTITCGSSCPALTHAANASFTLLAKPGPNASFIGWTDGPCRGTAPKCTFALTGPTTITATFGPQSYMFVTSSTIVPGKLGGLAGADDFCQRSASKAGLPGAYKAWLSTSGTPASSRVGSGGWVRTDGRPFTKNLAALTTQASPTVYYPPRIDEFGNDLGNAPNYVATGGDSKPPTALCADYTSTSGGLYLGDPTRGSFGWMMSVLESSGCSQSYRLYCFRTDGVVGDFTPPTQPGRRVFVSANPFSPGGAVGPDQMCQADAAAANLANANQFIAFLSTTTMPALKRLSANGPPWKRVDDVFVVRRISDFSGGKLLAPLGLSADGSLYRQGNYWSGASDPTAAATATCKDWTSNASVLSAMVGDCDTTESPYWYGVAPVTCDAAINRLICIEP